MDMQQIENTVIVILSDFDGSLPVEQLSEMRELVKAGEPGVALENLCSQLYEYDVVVPQVCQREIAKVGAAMGLPERTWKKLDGGGV